MNVPTTAPEVPVLPLVPSHEETLLREAVSGIAAGFGPAYIRQKVEAEEPPTELWEALAERGYLGVNLPEEYDGGGRGMTELAAVGEELAKAGCPLLLLLVSPAIAGSVLARHGTPDQKERWLRGIGRGDLRVAFAITEPDAGTNTHNLSTRAERRNGSLRAARHEDLHLGRGRRARAAGRGADRHQRGERAGLAVAVHRGHGRAGPGAPGGAHRTAQRRPAVAAVLR